MGEAKPISPYLWEPNEDDVWFWDRDNNDEADEWGFSERIREQEREFWREDEDEELEDIEFLGDGDDSGSRPGPQPSRELNESNGDGESEEPVWRRRRLNKVGDSDQQGPVAVVQSEK